MSASLKQQLPTKFKAAGWHLLISGSAFLVILLVIWQYWFPAPFFVHGGGYDGIRLMAMIDLVLGPMLTLIIYQQTKSTKEKVFDFSVIGILQLSAMIWGGYTVYHERPVAIAFWQHTFYTITDDFIQQQQQASLPEMPLPEKKQHRGQIPLYYAKPPETTPEKQTVLNLSQQNIPPYAQIQLLAPFRQYQSQVFAASRVPDDLKAQATTLSQQYQQPLHVLPLQTKYRLIALFLNQEGVIVDYQVIK